MLQGQAELGIVSCLWPHTWPGAWKACGGIGRAQGLPPCPQAGQRPNTGVPQPSQQARSTVTAAGLPSPVRGCSGAQAHHGMQPRALRAGETHRGPPLGNQRPCQAHVNRLKAQTSSKIQACASREGPLLRKLENWRGRRALSPTLGWCPLRRQLNSTPLWSPAASIPQALGICYPKTQRLEQCAWTALKFLGPGTLGPCRPPLTPGWWALPGGVSQAPVSSGVGAAGQGPRARDGARDGAGEQK